MKKRLTNWGNFPAVNGTLAEFTGLEELKAIIRSNPSVIARGNGRCYGDASLSADVMISTLKYNKIILFDDENGVIECEAGVKLNTLLKVIVPKGWFLPVTPGTKFITIGGAVASDVHGKNHHIAGCFSAYILRMCVMLSNGEITYCSREEKPDLFYGTCGGMGLTGIITSVKFQLKKIETAYIKQTAIKAGDFNTLLDLMEVHRSCTYSIAWIDCLRKGTGFGRGLLFLGEHAFIQELNTKRKKKYPLKLPRTQRFYIPLNVPSWILNKQVIDIFNCLYYGKYINTICKQIVSYESFFYPLDSISNWNRLYGKNGFIQYQFALPVKQKNELLSILKTINNKGWGTFLATLKILGAQSGLLSFPMEGYTLALDFPLRDGLMEFLDQLDDLVVKYGGRVYLSKDARMKPFAFWNGYPDAERFAIVLDKYNPYNKFRSLQSERLAITV